MKIMMFFSVSLTMALIMINHPVSMVILISLQTLVISILTSFMLPTSWFSLILFLIFMGGLMVLFIYISSLASNEKFTSPKMNYPPYIFFVLLFLFFLLNKEPIMNHSSNSSFKILIYKIYSENSLYLTAFIMLYLLVTLIVAATIISMYEGPMRSTTSI